MAGRECGEGGLVFLSACLIFTDTNLVTGGIRPDLRGYQDVDEG